MSFGHKKDLNKLTDIGIIYSKFKFEKENQKMFKYETPVYKFLAWSSVVAIAARLVCLLGALCALVLFFLPLDVSESLISRIAIGCIAADFFALAFLFFSSFQTKFFRKPTVWSFVGALAILLLALTLCVVLVTFEPGSFGAIAFEILSYLLIGVYMTLPGYLSLRDVTQLFKKLSAEAKERERSVAERVRAAKRY